MKRATCASTGFNRICAQTLQYGHLRWDTILGVMNPTREFTRAEYFAQLGFGIFLLFYAYHVNDVVAVCFVFLVFLHRSSADNGCIQCRFNLICDTFSGFMLLFLLALFMECLSMVGKDKSDKLCVFPAQQQSLRPFGRVAYRPIVLSFDHTPACSPIGHSSGVLRVRPKMRPVKNP